MKRTWFVIVLASTIIPGILSAAGNTPGPPPNVIGRYVSSMGDNTPRPAPLWGNNAQVWTGSVYKYDVDYRANGEIYLGVIYPSTNRNFAGIYKSTDGGLNWLQFIYWTSNVNRKFTDIALVCGDSALYVFMPQDTANGESRDYMAKCGYTGGTGWYHFSDTTYLPAGIIYHVDVDRSGAPGDTMVLVYEAESLGVFTGTGIQRSVDGGVTWTPLISGSSIKDARISWIRDNRWIMAFKSYLPGSSLNKLTVVSLSNDGGNSFMAGHPVDLSYNDTLNVEPCVTACRATGRAVIVTTHYPNYKKNGDFELLYDTIYCYQAVDEGDTTYQRICFQPTGEQCMPTVNCLRFGVNGWLDMAYQDDLSNSIRYCTNQYGDSGSWGSGQIVSDSMSSPSTGPTIAYCNDGSHAGPAVFYTGYGQNNIYMNTGWIAGVAGSPAANAGMGQLKLEQNAPNPFQQGTMINYQLPKPGQVSLKVYNITGQLVATLADGWQLAGRHSVSWDGHDGRGRAVSSGVYLYRLEAGGQSVTNKLTVIK